MDKMIFNPDSIRGLGNIVSSKDISDYLCVGDILEDGTDENIGDYFIFGGSGTSPGSVTLVSDKSVLIKNNDVSLTATVKTSSNVPIPDVSVTFKNGDNILGTADTNEQGKATFVYTPTAASTLSLTAVIGGVSSSSVSVRVKNDNNTANVLLYASPSDTCYVGDTVEIIARVTDSEGDRVPGRTVTYSSATAGTTDSNGECVVVQVNPLVTGTMSIGPVVVDDVTSDSVTLTVQESVIPVDSVTLVRDTSALTVGGTVKFTATVEDSNGNPIVNRTVTFKNNGTIIGTANTDNDGEAVLNYETSSVGTMSVTATCDSVTSSAVSVSVENIATSTINLSTSSASVAYGSTVTLSGTLTGAGGSGVGSASVKLYDGASLVDTLTTNVSGAFSTTITASVLGSHSYKVVYDGDNNHSSAESSSVSVTVGKATPTLTVSGDATRTITQGSTNYFTGSLSANGSGISGATVELYEVGGQEPASTATTASDGSYSLAIPSDTVYNYFIYMVKYWGNANYEAVVSDNMKVIVVAPTSVPGDIDLTGDKSILSKADNERCLLTATVYDDTASALPLEGETVTFSIVGGSTIGTAVTDSNGECSVYYYSEGTGDLNIQASCRSLLSETYSIRDAKYYADNTRINSLLDSNGRAFINYSVEKNDMVKFKFNTKPTHCLMGIGTSQSSCFVMEFNTNQTKLHKSTGTSTYNSNWVDSHSEIGVEIVAVSTSSDKANVYFEGAYADYWGVGKLGSNNNGLRVDKFTNDDFNIEIMVL